MSGDDGKIIQLLLLPRNTEQQEEMKRLGWAPKLGTSSARENSNILSKDLMLLRIANRVRNQ